MLRHLDMLLFCIPLILVCATCASAWPINYLSEKMGATIFTESRLQNDTDPNILLSDGVISKSSFFFERIDQDQTFTVDLGETRVFDRVEFGSIGLNEVRNAKQLVISVSSTGPDGPFQQIYERQNVGHFQIVRLPETQARWIRFDLGSGDEGAQVHSMRIYRGYRAPELDEVIQLLHEKIKPGIPGLESYYAAANSGDWTKAASELRAYYAKVHRPESTPDPDTDLTLAEKYATGDYEFAGIYRQDTVPIDWSYQQTRDWYEHKNFINRGRMTGYPLSAYYNTGLDLWRERFLAVFYDWVESNPCPPETIYADQPTWRTLDSAMRSGWLIAGFPLITSLESIDDRTWANFLYLIWQHANYLSHDTVSQKNWLSTVTSFVMDMALDFPEFTDQPNWLLFGRDGFETNVLNDIHPDGKEKEDAPGYVCMAHAAMFRTLLALDQAGVEVSTEVRERMDLVHDFLGAITQPNGMLAAIGDWGGGEPYSLNQTFEYFNREDIRYILTKGKEGRIPAWDSILFPHGQWAVMRTPFEYMDEPYEDARHLVFKASHESHGHRDYLQITLYAYGRPLLIDPGIKSYEREDGARYVQTAYHNTVCVDGKNQPPVWGNIDQWTSNNGMDYLLATYDGYEDVTHRRSILFVKPDYWILHDNITGDGNHTCDQNWHFNEDAGLTEDPQTNTVRTTYPECGNLMMIPVSTDGLISESKDFFIARARMTGTGEIPSQGWRYRKTGQLPAVFDLVMYPWKGAESPEITVTPLEAGTTYTTLLEIKSAEYRDLAFVHRNGVGEYSSEDLEVEAEVLVIRVRGETPVRISGTNVKRAVLNGVVLFESSEPVESLDNKL